MQSEQDPEECSVNGVSQSNAGRHTSVLRKLVNPQFAKETELDRPVSGWPERLFRISALVFLATGAAMRVPRLFLTKEQIEAFLKAHLGAAADLPGLLFVACFFYMLNYLAHRFVKSRLIRVAWFSLMALVVLCLVASYFMR